MTCGHDQSNIITCGACGFEWCDICIPTPGARSPCEYDHPKQDHQTTPDQEVRLAAIEVMECWNSDNLTEAIACLGVALELQE